MRVVVTGGCGFVGRVLVAELLRRDHEVVVLDRRDPEEAGVSFPAGVSLVRGDIRDSQAVVQAVAGNSAAVVHLAAVTSVLKSKENPRETFDTNVLATQLLLERSRQVGVETFVMASTNAVAGDVGDALIDEQTRPVPLTPYGATKAASEMIMSAYTASFSMHCTAIRLTNIYGPGMRDKDSFIPRMMRAARDGTGVAVYGDGLQVRDFVYVDDAVAGLLLPFDSGSTGVVTIGTGSSVSVLELHREMCKATGVEIPLSFEDAKPGEMRAVRVDVAHARSLGWRPRVELTEGLRRAWEDFSRR